MMLLADWTLLCIDDSSSTWVDACDLPSFVEMSDVLQDGMVRSVQGKARREKGCGRASRAC